MNKLFNFIFAICLLQVNGYGSTDSIITVQPQISKPFTPISGSLPQELKVDQSPYIVEADIFVSPGTSVTIESGVVLLFSNFTGLHVQGTLFVNGAKDHPVIFTSKNDPYYTQSTTVNAAPYDWNGLDIYETAIGTTVDNAIVQFSVYGIRSQTEHIKILNSFFLQNGKSNVTIKYDNLTVGTAAFSYNVSIKETSTLSGATVSDTTKSIAISDSPKKEKNGFRSILRYTSIILALGGIATGTLEYQQYKKAADSMDKISVVSDYNMVTYTSEDWNQANKKYKDESTKLAICGGVSGLGLLLFVISFTF